MNSRCLRDFSAEKIPADQNLRWLEVQKADGQKSRGPKVQKAGRTDGRKARWSEGQMSGRPEVQKDRRPMAGRPDGRKSRWPERQMDRRTDGQAASKMSLNVS